MQPRGCCCMCVDTLFCWFLWPMLADSKLAKIDIFCLVSSCCETLMQARACECVMGGSLDTMCQNTIAFVSKTDRMVIWTNFCPNLSKLTKNMIDQCLEFSLSIRFSRKNLNLKLDENWLKCMLLILTLSWHDFRTRNVQICLWAVLAWCPLTDTKTVSQCPSDGRKRDVASDAKYVWWRHDQTDVTMIRTRQSAMATGNWMSQSVRTFDQGMNPRWLRYLLTWFVCIDLISYRRR